MTISTAIGSVPGLNRWWISAPVAGIALGVLTNLAQGTLPGASNQIANSGAVWCVPAFTAGALVAAGGLAPRKSVLAGLGTTIGLVVGYYGYAEFGRSGMGNAFWPVVWLVTALVSGPLFGAAGAWWRRGRTVHRRVVGLAALAGVFGTEAVLAGRVLHYAGQTWACAALLVLIPLTLARGHKERALTLLTALPLSVIAYVVVELPLQQLSG
ncbi:DUF6518 family protein [Streptomyces sp. NPDC005648]|uniref:DUF6518 family protein n=1 Tax=Streptomyces sp. NPDC005648 TaxID=3157044 RepID=UPI00339EF87F